MLWKAYVDRAIRLNCPKSKSGWKRTVDVSQKGYVGALGTRLRRVACAATGQRATRAGDLTLPDDVPIAAVFGLHGLPLPPRTLPPRASAVAAYEDKKAVTPAVLAAVYAVTGVVPRRAGGNAQATLCVLWLLLFSPS